jgi:hypothetical protein
MTVLLWGVPSEPPLAMVAEELAALGADTVVVHPRHAAGQRIALRVPSTAGRAVDGCLDVGGRRIDLASVRGIYLRPVEPELVPELVGLPPGAPALAHARRLHDALLAFTEVAGAGQGCRVVNPLSAMASNMSKPFQAQCIVQHGFSTPATLVTDDAGEVVAFADRHRQIVYKSTSGVRSIVTAFDPRTEPALLDRLAWCPVQFQERVGGPDVRVHVVGGAVYAARIDTDALDYRYARTQVGADARLVRHELPDEIAERCVGLAQDLGLPFAGIDLKLPPDGRIVCFEVNPSPGFPWFERETGLPIAAAVAQWLLGAEG